MTVVLFHVERRRHKREYEHRLIDWLEVGLELRRSGWAAKRVAFELGLPKTTVLSWFNNAVEPGYSTGRRCLELFDRITGKPHPVPRGR